MSTAAARKSKASAPPVRLEELDLAYLPVEGAEFASDPLPYFEAARGKHPWLAKCSLGYVVTEYGAMRELFGMDGRMQTSFDNFVEIMDAKGTPWGRFTEEQMLAHSGGSHKRLRDMLAPKFTPRQANRHRPLMRGVIGELLDEWAPKGNFDFEEFASYFPITVFCKLLGASPDVIPQIRDSLEALGLTLSMDPKHLPALQDAVVQLDAFVQSLVADRKAQTRSGDAADMLDLLIDANGDDGLSDDELYNLLIFLLVAGYDTSKNVFTLTMNQLLDHPEVYARCAEDVRYCGKVIEEALRYLNTSNLFRQASEEFAYRDVLLPEGAMLFFPLSVAGRDPGAIDDPDTFNPDRVQDHRHMAFGRGMHLCLGQFIARAQLEEGLHQFARRIPNPKRAGPSGWRPFFGVWGMRGLPIEYQPTAQ